MQAALAELDERYRVALLLVFVEGLTCREAADELGVPLGTVLSRIHRARKAMREALGDDDERDDTKHDHDFGAATLRFGGTE